MEVGDPLVVPPQALGSAVSVLPWELSTSTAARFPALKIPKITARAPRLREGAGDATEGWVLEPGSFEELQGFVCAHVSVTGSSSVCK